VGTDEVRTMVERRVAALPGVKAVLDEVGVVPTARSLRRGL
jgi:hypothetical protein